MWGLAINTYLFIIDCFKRQMGKSKEKIRLPKGELHQWIPIFIDREVIQPPQSCKRIQLLQTAKVRLTDGYRLSKKCKDKKVLICRFIILLVQWKAKNEAQLVWLMTTCYTT